MTSPDSSANGSQGSEPLDYGPCVANPPKFSSVTPWDGMPIAEVLAIVDTMDSGRASGDAEAVRVALAMVGKVSSSLGSTFGESSLVGQGPDASVGAAGRLAAKIASSTEQVAGTVADLNAPNRPYREPAEAPGSWRASRTICDVIRNRRRGSAPW